MNAEELKRDLKDLATWTEAALDRLVPPAAARPAPLHAAMRHSLFAGGKRIRPALCAMWAGACGAGGDWLPVAGMGISLVLALAAVGRGRE